MQPWLTASAFNGLKKEEEEEEVVVVVVEAEEKAKEGGRGGGRSLLKFGPLTRLSKQYMYPPVHCEEGPSTLTLYLLHSLSLARSRTRALSLPLSMYTSSLSCILRKGLECI